MSEIKMRTRILGKLNNYEVEEYLERNSIIFVPVGTVELAGRKPLECEYTGPAGLSLAMAEAVDGLVMDGLKYFYCGATTNGRGTVQVSTRAGYDYLKELLYSLMCQGFKEIIMVSGHGPAEMTIVPCIWDFFDETKRHVWWINQGPAMQYAAKKLDPARDGFENLDLAGYGCYQILNCVEDLVVDAGAEVPKAHSMAQGMPQGDFTQRPGLPKSVEHILYPMNFATFSDATGFYFGSIEDHGGQGGAFRSVQERDYACAEGLKQLRKTVELMDMPRYIADIRAQQKYTDEEVLTKYHHLPKNRFMDYWKYS